MPISSVEPYSPLRHRGQVLALCVQSLVGGAELIHEAGELVNALAASVVRVIRSNHYYLMKYPDTRHCASLSRVGVIVSTADRLFSNEVSY